MKTKQKLVKKIYVQLCSSLKLDPVQKKVMSLAGPRPYWKEIWEKFLQCHGRPFMQASLLLSTLNWPLVTQIEVPIEHCLVHLKYHHMPYLYLTPFGTNKECVRMFTSPVLIYPRLRTFVTFLSFFYAKSSSFTSIFGWMDLALLSTTFYHPLFQNRTPSAISKRIIETPPRIPINCNPYPFGWNICLPIHLHPNWPLP